MYPQEFKMITDVLVIILAMLVASGLTYLFCSNNNEKEIYYCLKKQNNGGKQSVCGFCKNILDLSKENNLYPKCHNCKIIMCHNCILDLTASKSICLDCYRQERYLRQ